MSIDLHKSTSTAGSLKVLHRSIFLDKVERAFIENIMWTDMDEIKEKVQKKIEKFMVPIIFRRSHK